jgi:hypothetical protein
MANRIPNWGAGFMESFEMLSSDPAWIRTGLRVVHLCGLVLGVGSATLLDLIIARFILMRGISYEHVYVVDFSAKIVTIGLGLLWISGIGFLLHYGLFEPAKLQNPKIWAKIAIVAVLTINGFLVHFFVLPRIRKQVGKRLLDELSPFDCSLVLLAGTVSAISWYVPLILGAIPQLNYVVPAEVILSSYALLLTAVNTVIQGAIALTFFMRGHPVFVISDWVKISNPRKTNALRGVALALGSLCISLFVTKSLFMTKTAEHGTAFVQPATNPSAGEAKLALAPKEAVLELASSRGNTDVSGPPLKYDQSHIGAPGETSPVTAVGQSEGNVDRTVSVVGASSAPEQDLLVRTRGAESFASLSKGPGAISTPPLKSSFVGLWAADARACEFRPGSGTDLRTVIGERGARAGGNSCEFKKKKQIADSEWEMKASCADGSTRWESTVRLSISKNRLKWSGQRGTQLYLKCT